jgi:hypothetical protein
VISGPQDRQRSGLGRAALLCVLAAIPPVAAVGQTPAPRSPWVVCALADPRADAFRGPLAPALARPPAGVSIRRLDPGPPEALPARLRTLGAGDALWARILPGDRIGIRYFRAVPGELFEAELPGPVAPGGAEALAEAFWLKLQFMMAAPAGTGRPWPPQPPVPGPPDATLAARLDAPRVRAWPALPSWPLPHPPAALPGPPPPQGEVEIEIEARPGAEAPSMIFSPTAEHGVKSSPRSAEPAASPSLEPEPVRLGLLGTADLPTPWSIGGGLDLFLPMDLAGTPLWARFGLTSQLTHHPWDSTTADGGPLATWRGQARLGARFSAEALRLWAGGGPFVAHLSRIGSAGDAHLDATWQTGLEAGTLLGWAAGPLMPYAGFSFRVSPQSLRASSDGVEYTLAERWQIGVELGVAVSLGR